MATQYPEVNYKFKLPISNFKILKIQDLFQSTKRDSFTIHHKVNFYTLIFITNDIGRHSIDYKDFYMNSMYLKRDDGEHFGPLGEIAIDNDPKSDYLFMETGHNT